MFGTQNLATSLLPCNFIYHTYCGIYHSYCGIGYYSYCPYVYFSHCINLTGHCGPTFAIPAQVGPGDPVEGLKALRQQLEVTLAGVRAQEEEVQRQRAATSREGA